MFWIGILTRLKSWSSLFLELPWCKKRTNHFFLQKRSSAIAITIPNLWTQNTLLQGQIFWSNFRIKSHYLLGPKYYPKLQRLCCDRLTKRESKQEYNTWSIVYCKFSIVLLYVNWRYILRSGSLEDNNVT